MLAPLESSVVRIYSKSGTVVGAGCLVSSKYILTCAHVVTNALGLAKNTLEKPDLEIKLDFPLLAAKQLFAAKVIFWRPLNPIEQIEDIAGLELVDSPPNTAKPAQLIPSEDLWKHSFRVLGFPATQPDGALASGVLLGRTAKGWVQLEDVKQTGYRLEPGFSGAPVWDEELEGVVGIAVSAENQEERQRLKVAFIIPSEILISAWSVLSKQAENACPYRGLSAFQDNNEDKDYFFGRETFVDGLVRVVQQQPLVAVIGSSGSGKSSVVLAGLIPKLREEGSWLIKYFRPNKQPFYELAAALISLLEPELGKTDKNIKAKELAESIRKHGFTADVWGILNDNPGKRLLLVVDQFEELYTGCADTEQQQFLDTLLATVESASRSLTLVLTLRADFYSYVANYPPLGEALNKYPAKNLILMNPEEMQVAIELPAEKKNVKLEEKLTERILNDVKQEPGTLPLLEFALTQLWEKQSQGRLTHQAYSAIGGVAKALSNHAEAVYGKLSEREQKQAQRIFLQLVLPGEGTEDTRRVATRGEVGEECWELISRTDGLATARLVVTDTNKATGEKTVEVVHEALIREWALLRQWINENRKKLIQKREIEDAAKRWGDRGKAKDYLLQGKVLTEARVFQKEESGNLRLSNLAKDFIKKGLIQKRNNRIWLGLISIIIVSVATFLGIITAKEIKIRQLWAIVKKPQRIDNPARIEALQELVKAQNSLARIDLSYVNLSNVDFGGADLSRAILLNADLNGANLSGANLSRTSLINGNLSGADISSADLANAKLMNANLSNAKLMNADLTNADLSNAKLSSANLNGATLIDADLSQANFDSATLQGTDLINAKLSRVNFRRSILFNANFSDANLSDADFSNAKVYYANFRNANLSGVNLSNADLRNSDFSDANLSGANLKNTNLSGATNLNNTNFYKTNLSDANLSCWDELLNGKHICPDFRGAKNLTPQQVKSAKNWQQAIYDKEFRKKLGLK